MKGRKSWRRGRSGASKTARFDWHIPLLGGALLLLWTTNRRRIKPNFELSGDGSIDVMVPSLIGLTEGAIDPGNRVEILQNGVYFDRLLDDIAAARGSIHIESYIWWTGEICERIADALAARAGDGVEVRLLLDYSGSSRMDRTLMKRMKDAGCEVRQFRPLRVSNIGMMNNRTHRKIAVFDGRVAYVGGHGIAEEWTGNAEDRDHWRDTFVRMEGPVANTVQGCFCENWIEETGEVPVGEAYYPKLEKCGPTDAHVAYTSPHGSISSVQMLYYLAISSAHKELLIQNPYFLPHEDAIGALVEAVKRGVDVQIMLPSASVIDSPLVQHASHHHFGDLLERGVRIFEYRKTLLHQKIIIVDGVWSCVGSTNFDDRSFQRNDEITVGFTDRELAQKLRAAFFDDMKDAREVRFEEWKSRPWHHKLTDAAAFAFRAEL
ncbi:MAG TPA: cardiolipin synthase [Thermoanaerobaculia bacterium]|nr:cardiolipin synthase [Thermoanaerobaculia bacterium]